MVKEYGRHEDGNIQLLIFVSVCVVFFWPVFSIFRELSNISLIRYFFVEALTIQKYLSDGNFRKCLPT